MKERKTVAINLRMAPGMKELLRRAAEHEHRTLSNMLEVLILEHCRLNGIRPSSDVEEAPADAASAPENRRLGRAQKK